jgi:CO/xanthine dehydrogenase FAD-binding subunit
MKPASFEYHVPDSIEQALDHLHEYGSEAKLLAGGQSLIPAEFPRGLAGDIDRP